MSLRPTVAQIWWPSTRTLLHRRIVFRALTTALTARSCIAALRNANQRHLRCDELSPKRRTPFTDFNVLTPLTHLTFSILLSALIALPVFGNENAKFSDISQLLPKPSLASTTTNSTSPGPNAPSLPLPNSMDTLDDKHMLAIGDHLSFRIEEDRLLAMPNEREQDDTKQLFVTDTGEIDVPYIGRLPAANKTCKKLACEIKAALEKDYYQQATVILAVDLMTKSRGKVYLVGPVRVPGPQDIPSDEVLTLSRAILRAGGFTDFADRKDVKVTRKASTGGEKQTFVVDVGQILDKGKTETDLVLQSEDLIYVPERLVRF